eukprot:6181049-Pleurochrysis_carterae.AAC.3
MPRVGGRRISLGAVAQAPKKKLTSDTGKSARTEGRIVELPTRAHSRPPRKVCMGCGSVSS